MITARFRVALVALLLALPVAAAAQQRVILDQTQPDLTTTFKIDWTKIAGTTLSTGNGTADAGTQRVTIASNSTGVVGLSTGSNVVGAVTQSGTWTAQPGNTANTTPWLFSIAQGGNTAAVNASSQLSVVCANCSGSGVSQVDNSGFTPGTTVFVPVGGEVDDTGTTAVAENSAGAARITVQRGLHVNLRTVAGAETGVAAVPLQVSLANTGANGTPVTVAGAVTNAGTFAVQDSQKIADDAAFTVATTPVQPVGYLADSTSTDSVNEGDLGAARMTLDRVAYAGAAAVADISQATASCYITSAASTNSTNCKASAGNIYAIHVTNTTTTNYFLRLYNASSAPTCSSATGFIETIPALGASANGGINGRVVPAGEAYDTGIGFCLTGGGSSTDNTNAATGVYVSIRYK